ncbi:hypothetical protein [Chlorobium sp.]|uniref:hypothetical protein n=1 Tax=Chlorobium sp. TaxID=1095 RepID=UPI0025B87EB2|nr:hypothetical protein [Chlorobium sp.]
MDESKSLEKVRNFQTFSCKGAGGLFIIPSGAVVGRIIHYWSLHPLVLLPAVAIFVLLYA